MKKVYQVVWYTGEDDEFHAKEFEGRIKAEDFAERVGDCIETHDVAIYEYSR